VKIGKSVKAIVGCNAAKIASVIEIGRITLYTNIMTLLPILSNRKLFPMNAISIEGINSPPIAVYCPWSIYGVSAMYFSINEYPVIVAKLKIKEINTMARYDFRSSMLKTSEMFLRNDFLSFDVFNCFICSYRGDSLSFKVIINNN
jgi:hypothetical protein